MVVIHWASSHRSPESAVERLFGSLDVGFDKNRQLEFFLAIPALPTEQSLDISNQASLLTGKPTRVRE